MKPNKIIAVDTSLGTNFLVSAFDDATVSELRGIIQMGHLSCFPEHGSINVLALTVQYKQKQYHVTDSLLIGQICRKSWSNIHAEVSLGSLRAASTSHSSRSAEAESLANGKAGNECAALDDTLVANCSGSKGLEFDRQSSEALAHSSSPLLCVEKLLKVSCNEMIPIMSNSQTSSLDHRCPLLSMEAPYTQSHSQLNLATRAALSKEVSGKGHQCKKRQCAEEEIVGRKRNQGIIIHNFDKDKDQSPAKKNAINIKGEINSQDHEGSSPKGQQVAQMKGHAQLMDALKEPPQAPTTGEAQVAEAHKEPKTNELKWANTDDSILRIQSNDLLCLHSNALVGSPLKSKPTSSLSERDFAAFEKEATNKAPDTARIEGLSSPKMSSENQAEGMEDANLNSGAQVSKMDLSMGYPIQLNDHSTLFVASLSADVVPETQESQMQNQDVINAEGEEVALAKIGVNVYEHAASREPHSNSSRQDLMACEEVGAQCLPPHQDARSMNPMDVHNNEENLTLLAEKKETSNPKPSVVADAKKRDVGTLGAHTNMLDRQLHDTGLSGGNHDIPLVQKKKKRKRKKVSEIHKVSVQEDSRFIASAGRGIPGDLEPKKDAAHLLKNLTEMCNIENEGERGHMLERQAQTAGNVDALNTDDAHPNEFKRQNGTALSVEQGNARESPCFTGEKRSREKFIECSLKGENCEAAIQEEMLSMKEGGVTQAGTTRRKKKRRNGTTLRVDQGNHRESPSFAGEERIGEKLIEGNLKGENCEATMQGAMLGMKEGVVTQVGTTRRKKKRRRKERLPPSPVGDLGDNPLNMGNEGGGVPFTIKELPNVLGLIAVKEGVEFWSSTAKVVGEQVGKEGKEKETVESDPNIIQEKDQDHATIDHANREALLKDGRLVATSSTTSHSKDCSQAVKTQRGFDVFDFESSETGNRVKENCKNNDATSISEANNLEKLCAAAVKVVEDEMLSPSKTTTTRKSSRKAVHPKRWITVLTERLTWNQTSKNNSKKKHRANERSNSIAKGASLPKNEELNSEPLYVEEGEANEERSQIILGDGRVVCSKGCGRLYTKKTSAYYRHCRMCSGGDHGCLS